MSEFTPFRSSRPIILSLPNLVSSRLFPPTSPNPQPLNTDLPSIYNSKKHSKQKTNTSRYCTGERRQEKAGSRREERVVTWYNFDVTGKLGFIASCPDPEQRRSSELIAGNGRETGSLELLPGRVNCAFLPANVCY